MHTRRTLITTASTLAISTLAGCAGLLGKNSTPSTNVDGQPPKTPVGSGKSPGTPHSAREPLVTQARETLGKAQSVLATVGLVRGGHVFFDPKTVIPFDLTAVTSLTAEARTFLADAHSSTMEKSVAEDLADLERVADVIDAVAETIPEADTALSSSRPYNASVNSGDWSTAMKHAVTGMDAAKRAWRSVTTAQEAAAGIVETSPVNGFETAEQQVTLDVLNEAFTALGATYLGFYHTSYGMLWWEAALQVGSEGKPSAAADAMGSAVESFSYALSALGQALDNEELVYQQEAHAHFCAAEAIAYAAAQFRQSYEATVAGDDEEAQICAGKAMNALEEAECDVAYEEHALESAREKAL